ncbi:MAG: SGNH hydrolase domain-containing protein, partial [Mesorhizobium sp.]|nr:SGNH hydrolase domain-containing protein [Mesorhizobium sp.]
ALAGAIWWGQGWAGRSPNYFPAGFVQSQIQAKRMTDFRRICPSMNMQACIDAPRTDRLRVAVMGNSHGGDGLSIIMPALGGEQVIFDSLPGCPPFPATSILANDFQPRCVEFNRRRVSPESLATFDVIVVSVWWGRYTPKHLREFLDAVNAAAPASKVVVFGNYVTLNTMCWEIIERLGTRDCLRPEFEAGRFLYEDELKKTVAEYGYLFVSKRDALCAPDGTGCQSVVGDIPFTWDQHHLSYEFAHMLGEKVKGTIRAYVYGRED